MQTFSYRGATYQWNQHRWTDENFLEVDARTARELDTAFPRPRMGASALARLRADRREHGTPGTLLTPSQVATQDAACAAVTCAMLRDAGQLEKALAITERWKDSRQSGVLIARAAVLCDLDRWQEARTLAKRAAAGGGGFAADSVLGRIKRELGDG